MCRYLIISLHLLRHVFSVGHEAKDASRQYADILIRAHLMYIFGDIPAMAKVLHMGGNNSYCGCRFCLLIGALRVNETKGGHVYFPLKKPIDQPPRVPTSSSAPPRPDYDASALPMRTREAFSTAWTTMYGRPELKKRVARETG